MNCKTSLSSREAVNTTLNYFSIIYFEINSHCDRIQSDNSWQKSQVVWEAEDVWSGKPRDSLTILIVHNWPGNLP